MLTAYTTEECNQEVIGGSRPRQGPVGGAGATAQAGRTAAARVAGAARRPTMPCLQWAPHRGAHYRLPPLAACSTARHSLALAGPPTAPSQLGIARQHRPCVGRAPAPTRHRCRRPISTWDCAAPCAPRALANSTPPPHLNLRWRRRLMRPAPAPTRRPIPTWDRAAPWAPRAHMGAWGRGAGPAGRPSQRGAWLASARRAGRPHGHCVGGACSAPSPPAALPRSAAERGVCGATNWLHAVLSPPRSLWRACTRRTRGAPSLPARHCRSWHCCNGSSSRHCSISGARSARGKAQAQVPHCLRSPRRLPNLAAGGDPGRPPSPVSSPALLCAQKRL
jgi:hypothetical protein